MIKITVISADKITGTIRISKSSYDELELTINKLLVLLEDAIHAGMVDISIDCELASKKESDGNKA